ncbi:hypothetical protein HK104_006427 [Borealophlyctis nickersoniae]|nr:hypothetical protein HK104_006427 [Borealophlyctis nickersoniae]
MRQHILHTHHLSVAQSKYTAAQQSDKEPSLASMRRFVEDLRIQKSKVQDLAGMIDSVVAVPLSHWQPEALALQVAIIDAALFAKVRPREDLVQHGDHHGAVPACIDFERYLSRVMVNAVVSSGERGGAPPQQNIAFAVTTAYLLLYVYRDLNGVSAILSALSSPEITRLHRVWEVVPSRTKDLLSSIKSVFASGSGLDHVALLAELLRHHHRGGGVMSVIPNLGPIVSEIEDINSAYMAGVQGDAVSKGAVLSDIGARALEEVLITVQLCQGVGRPEALDLERVAAQSQGGGHLDNTSTTDSSMPKAPDDLNALGVGDLALEHWLLTRVYWSRRDLWWKSGECEPLRVGEVYPYKDELPVTTTGAAGRGTGGVAGRSTGASGSVSTTFVSQATSSDGAPLTENASVNAGAPAVEDSDVAAVATAPSSDSDLLSFPSIPTNVPNDSDSDSDSDAGNEHEHVPDPGNGQGTPPSEEAGNGGANTGISSLAVPQDQAKESSLPSPLAPLEQNEAGSGAESDGLVSDLDCDDYLDEDASGPAGEPSVSANTSGSQTPLARDLAIDQGSGTEGSGTEGGGTGDGGDGDEGNSGQL